jgi:hypothetical protein
MSRAGGALHITNGDSVLYLFRKAGVLGTHVGWRDVLHEGPVPPGKLEDVSAIRTRYLASRGYGKPIKVNREFEQRDALLRRAREFDEIVLWFEHDLFDQLQMLQILDTLGQMDREPGRVSLVQSDSYLGMLDVNELSALLPKRRTVTDGIFASARAAWMAFTCDDPLMLTMFSREERLGMPFLRAAFARLCEEYPGRDGLSRSQRQALEAVSRGPGDKDELFRRAQAREEAAFMGDASFFALLDDLAALPSPAIEQNADDFTATAIGRRLLAGDGDWLEAQTIDRYVGGVHLTNANAWRYDEEARQFLEPPR